MHELSLAQSICRAIVERTGRVPLATIRLKVGVLSGVVPDSLEFCLGEVARLEGLGEPRVEIELVQPILRCACGREYTAEDILQACPVCGGYQREVVAGTDLTVTSVDVLTEETSDVGREKPPS